MAIEKQIIELPLDLGLDTKTDEKNLSNGALATAENVVYETLKSLKKRNGYDKIITRELDNTPIENIKKLSKFKNELLAFTDDQLYSYSALQDKWINKGSFYSASPTAFPIIANDSEQLSPSFAYIEGYKCYGYEDRQSGRSYYSVIDSLTGAFLVSFEELDINAKNVKLCYIGTVVYAFYVNSTNLKYKKFSVFNPGDLSSSFTVATDFEFADNQYDVEIGDDKIYIVYNSSDGANPLKALTVDSDDNISTSISFTGESASDAIDIRYDPLPQDPKYVISYSNGTEVKYIVSTEDLSDLSSGPTLIEAIAGVTNVTAISRTGNNYDIYYEVSDVDASNHYIKKAQRGADGSGSTVSGWDVRSIGLAGKAFKSLNGKIFIPAIHDSALQATNFIIDEDGNLVSKYNAGEAGTVTQNGGLPYAFEIENNVIELVSSRKGIFTADNGDFESLLGVTSIELDFEVARSYKTASMGNNVHITGGIIQMYDGDRVVEHGFQLFPEGLFIGTNSDTGGNMSNGKYDYVAVYAWTDNYGNIHRSAPSPSITVELNTHGTNTQTQAIGIPTLRLTQRDDVVVELYRTEGESGTPGTLFYKVGQFGNNPANNTTAVEDSFSDEDLISQEALYTTGGVLDNIAADGAKLITSFKNRIVLAGQEDNVLQYSKIVLEGRPVEFNDTLTIKLPSDGQEETAIIEMDEKLIIFKQSSIYFVAGDGPNNLGEEDNFTEPELISSDIGCSDSGSVVLTPLGVMFKSLKGIYVLTNSLSLNYVGDRVEAFNRETIEAVDVVGELNQIRFLTNNNIALIYNYHLDKWATFTNHGGVSSVVIGNDYYYLRTDETIFKENRTVFADNGAPIKMRITTGWLYLGDIQGFQRIYKAFVLGSFKSDHKVKVRVAYDFVNIFQHEKVFDIKDFINTSTYGEESPYGEPDTSYYGSSNDLRGNRYQYRIDMKRQKCQSIKLSIEDLQNETVGEGLSISGITFQIGAKGGPFRIESNRQYGAG